MEKDIEEKFQVQLKIAYQALKEAALISDANDLDVSDWFLLFLEEVSINLIHKSSWLPSNIC